MTQASQEDRVVDGVSHALALSELGRYREALDTILRVLAQEPEYQYAHALAASFHISLGENAQAAAAAERAVALDPEDDWSHCLRSIALLRMKKKRESLVSAREAARLNPESPHVQMVLCDAEIENKNFKEAEAAAGRVLTMAPDTPIGYHSFGLIALKRRKWKEAEKHFRKALEISPEDYESMNNLGVALSHQFGRRKESMEAFHQAVRIRPSEKLAQGNLHSSARRYVYGGVGLLFFHLIRSMLRAENNGTLANPRVQFFMAALILICLAGSILWISVRRGHLAQGTRMLMRAESLRKRSGWRRRFGAQ